MEFLNYFDIPDEELEYRDVKDYVNSIYRKLNAPKGKIHSLQILPHEEKGIKRVCAIYKVEEDIELVKISN
jgi:hypothetical protein